MTIRYGEVGFIMQMATLFADNHCDKFAEPEKWQTAFDGFVGGYNLAKTKYGNVLARAIEDQKTIRRAAEFAIWHTKEMPMQQASDILNFHIELANENKEK